MEFKTIKFKHLVTFEDVYAIQLLLQGTTSRYITAGFGIFIIIISLSNYLKTFDLYYFFPILLGLSLIFFLQIVALLYTKNIWKKVKQFYIEPYIYEITNNGMKFGNRYSSMSFSWDSLLDYKDDKRYLLLKFSPNIPCCINKSGMNHEEKERVLRLIKEKRRKK